MVGTYVLNTLAYVHSQIQNYEERFEGGQETKLGFHVHIRRIDNSSSGVLIEEEGEEPMYSNVTGYLDIVVHAFLHVSKECFKQLISVRNLHCLCVNNV